MKNQNKLKHHFVPQGLLRNWYSRDEKGMNGLKKISRKPNNTINFNPPHVSAKSCCSEEHLYTLNENLSSIITTQNTNILEDYFGDIDNNGLKSIRKIIDDENLDELDEQQYHALYKFLAAFHFRSPEKINFVTDELKDRISGYKIISHLQSSFEAANIGENYQKLIDNAILTSMQSVLESNSYLDFFRNLEYIVFSTQKDTFFSGENPFIVNFKPNENVVNTGFILALSPTKLLFGVNKNYFVRLNKRGLFIDWLCSKIALHNQWVCEQSKYIISSKPIENTKDKEMIEKYLATNIM
ncbi:hypothetical protein B8W92_10375 [Moraxella osloensis]|nr:DUF4238 domain-containing protein [Moraxella osloensis]PAL13599.1 hypothetical protein B8W92_10375 [Moraxella osloensis]